MSKQEVLRCAQEHDIVAKVTSVHHDILRCCASDDEAWETALSIVECYEPIVLTREEINLCLKY